MRPFSSTVRLQMENSNSTSRKVFSSVYALLAFFSAFLMLKLLLTNQAFVDFRGGLLFVVAAFTFVVTSISVWVKWNDTFLYKYETPYKTSPITNYLKAIFGSFAITLGLFITFIVIGLFTAGLEKVDYIIDNFGGYIVLSCTVLFFPLIKKYMK